MQEQNSFEPAHNQVEGGISEQQNINTNRTVEQEQLMVSSTHKKYGKMLVLYDRGSTAITLGPDYWCFLPTFTIFTMVSFFLTRFIFNYSENIYFRVSTILICWGLCLSYLAVATSNPGIVTEDSESEEEENPMSQENVSKKSRICKKCNIRTSKGTYHCSDCDVCIRGYDHHCPWTSKCIGEGNLCRFYIFLAMVPIYLIYTFVAFATVMSAVAIQSSTAHLKKHHGI